MSPSGTEAPSQLAVARYLFDAEFHAQVEIERRVLDGAKRPIGFPFDRSAIDLAKWIRENRDEPRDQIDRDPGGSPHEPRR